MFKIIAAIFSILLVASAVTFILDETIIDDGFLVDKWFTSTQSDTSDDSSDTSDDSSDTSDDSSDTSDDSSDTTSQNENNSSNNNNNNNNQSSTPVTTTNAHGTFYYDNLDELGKKLYTQMLEKYQDFDVSLSLKGEFENLTSDEVSLIHRSVLLDHPEIFWMSTSTSTYSAGGLIGNDKLTKLVATINIPKKKALEYTKQFEAVASGIISEAQALPTDYDKALFLYEYIVKNCEYDSGALATIDAGTQDDQSILSGTLVGCLTKNTAVCSGYSKAYAYLLNQVGIEAFSVLGRGRGAPHEWNMKNLDGEYYQMDITWGDPVFSGEKKEDYISYDYFCVTSEIMNNTHSLSLDFKYPACNATKYNYYAMNDLMFSTYDSVTSKDALKRILQETVDNKEDRFAIAFESKEEYNKAVYDLIDQSGMFALIDEFENELENSYSHIISEDTYGIEIYLSYK